MRLFKHLCGWCCHTATPGRCKDLQRRRGTHETGEGDTPDSFSFEGEVEKWHHMCQHSALWTHTSVLVRDAVPCGVSAIFSSSVLLCLNIVISAIVYIDQAADQVEEMSRRKVRIFFWIFWIVSLSTACGVLSLSVWWRVFSSFLISLTLHWVDVYIFVKAHCCIIVMPAYPSRGISWGAGLGRDCVGVADYSVVACIWPWAVWISLKTSSLHAGSTSHHWHNTTNRFFSLSVLDVFKKPQSNDHTTVWLSITFLSQLPVQLWSFIFLVLHWDATKFSNPLSCSCLVSSSLDRH